jgi:hypothetical protein
MNIVIESESGVYIDANKHIKKLIKWCNKNITKYFSIVRSVENCILVTASSKVSTPTWFSFEALNACGDGNKFVSVNTDQQIKKQLYKLTEKAKGFECVIETNDNYPTGIHPYFNFIKDDINYCLIIHPGKIAIYIYKNED